LHPAALKAIKIMATVSFVSMKLNLVKATFCMVNLADLFTINLNLFLMALFLQTANWADEVDEEEKQEAQQKADAGATAPATEEDGEFFNRLNS
jgi:hypothetical protein